MGAANALGSLRTEKAVDPLLKTLHEDQESLVRTAAARALGPARAESAVPELVRTLEDRDQHDIWESVDAALREILIG